MLLRRAARLAWRAPARRGGATRRVATAPVRSYPAPASARPMTTLLGQASQERSHPSQEPPSQPWQHAVGHGSGAVGASVFQEAVRSSNGVEKSVSDELEYRAVELGNRLRVMLISDASTDKAACAMDVGVGHLSDPDEIPGLAHFLEHMLFLGTRKYPDANAYAAFLSENGGRSNAFTATENTNYYFDVSHGALRGALDRFAQFFISPLFTAGATERELLAVDQEHAKNLQDDFWRSYQLEKTTSNAAHPYHKFATGDSKTLRDSPAARGVDVRAALLSFHARHYSANRMRLCVLGREPLDALERMVRELFDGIADTDAPAPHLAYGSRGQLPLGEREQGRRLEMVPVKDLRSVELTWALPSMLDCYDRAPHKYVGNLLGHEGPGSILSLLKSKGWANELSAGLAMNQSDFSLYKLQIECTHEGIGKVDEIVAAVFAYLDLVRRDGYAGVQDWLWHEVALQAANAFRFRSKGDPSSTASKVAGAMQVVPVEHALSHQLLRSFDRAGIQAMLDQLTPERMQLLVLSQEVAGRAELLSEKWYGTQYAISRVDAATQRAWRQGDLLADSDKQALHLPHPNAFLPSDFALQPFVPPQTFDAGRLHECVDNVSPLLVEALRQTQRVPGYELAPEGGGGDQSVEQEQEQPQPQDQHARRRRREALSRLVTRSALKPWGGPGGAAAADTDLWRPPALIAAGDQVGGLLWLKQDTAFKLPKTNVTVLIQSPVCYENPRAAVLSELYTQLVQDRLSEYSYAAEIAGLYYSMRNTTSGVALSVAGYTHKLPALLATVADGLSSPDKLAAKEFARFKDKFARDLRNFDKEQAYQHAAYAGSVLLNLPRWHIDDKLKEVDVLTVEDVRAHAERVLRSASLETLVTGNATPDMAHAYARAVRERIGAMQPAAVLDSSLVPRVVKLPRRSESFFMQPGRDPDNVNSAIELMLQVGPDDPLTLAPLHVIAQIAQEPCFNTLRTEQQLGYIVFCGTRSDNGIVALRVIVQSSRADPHVLDDRIERFLQQLEGIIGDMSEAALQQNIDAVLMHLLEKDKTGASEARRWANEIELHVYRFSRAVELAAAVAQVTKKDVQRFFREYLGRDAPQRRKLVVGIFGAKHKGAQAPGQPAQDGAAELDAAQAAAHTIAHRGAPAVFQITSIKQFRTANALYPVHSRCQL